jgi:hypothetical protein
MAQSSMKAVSTVTYVHCFNVIMAGKVSPVPKCNDIKVYRGLEVRLHVLKYGTTWR